MEQLPGTPLPAGQVVYGWRRIKPIDESEVNPPAVVLEEVEDGTIDSKGRDG